MRTAACLFGGIGVQIAHACSHNSHSSESFGSAEDTLEGTPHATNDSVVSFGKGVVFVLD